MSWFFEKEIGGNASKAQIITDEKQRMSTDSARNLRSSVSLICAHLCRVNSIPRFHMVQDRTG